MNYNAPKTPTWRQCEAVFWKAQKAFGKDMVRYRRLNSRYLEMLAAYEASQSPLNNECWTLKTFREVV